MSLTFTVLGSGSSGNCTLLQYKGNHLLIDAGLSGKETCRRLAELAVAPESILGILLTHEHQDHIQGLRGLSKRFRIPVFSGSSTLDALRRNGGLDRQEPIACGQEFAIGGMSIQPFSVSHDCVDPMAFLIRAGGHQLGFAMDLGYISGLVRERLHGCDALILESNHDMEMLKAGPYPWELKQRVLGRLGHLSNEAVAQFLEKDFDGKSRYIVLAHLSQNNNHPDLALLSAQRALSNRGMNEEEIRRRVRLSYQNRSSETIRLDDES
jgi:phosphoribosyl 1,2-cyclic phosphodiesterase